MFRTTVFISLLVVAATFEEQGKPACSDTGSCGTAGQSLLQKQHSVLAEKVQEEGEGAEGEDDDDEATEKEGSGIWRRRRRTRRRRNRRRNVVAASTVSSKHDCHHKGGSHYNDCGGIKYCCGVCHGATTCVNNGGLLHCACTQEAEDKAAAAASAAEAAAKAAAEAAAEAKDKKSAEEAAEKATAETNEKAAAEAAAREAEEAAREAAEACDDTNDGAVDVYDYDCSGYPHCLAGGDASYTHDYDDDDFTAAEMCASCKKQSCSDGDQDDRGS